jgi:DnaJ-class molecular chaperone
MSYQEKTQPCPDCKGKGKVNVDGATYECKTCDGTGKVAVKENTPTNESTKIRLND